MHTERTGRAAEPPVPEADCQREPISALRYASDTVQYTTLSLVPGTFDVTYQSTSSEYTWVAWIDAHPEQRGIANDAITERIQSLERLPRIRSHEQEDLGCGIDRA
jgi:hypothetical protein